eukprot:5699751-Pyramimonas_sp.AAC.1
MNPPTAQPIRRWLPRRQQGQALLASRLLLSCLDRPASQTFGSVMMPLCPPTPPAVKPFRRVTKPRGVPQTVTRGTSQ